MKGIHLNRAPKKARAAKAAATRTDANGISSKLINPYLLVIAATVSGICGVIALRLSVNETAASKDFANQPSYAVWVASVSGTLMLATFLSGLAWRDFQRAWRLARKTTRYGTIAAYAAVGIATIFGTFWVISAPIYPTVPLQLASAAPVNNYACGERLLLLRTAAHKRYCSPASRLKDP